MQGATSTWNFTYQLNLRQEGIDLLPALEDALLFLGKVNRHLWAWCCRVTLVAGLNFIDSDLRALPRVLRLQSNVDESAIDNLVSPPRVRGHHFTMHRFILCSAA